MIMRFGGWHFKKLDENFETLNYQLSGALLLKTAGVGHYRTL
jgi:hypothetical protein